MSEPNPAPRPGTKRPDGKRVPPPRTQRYTAEVHNRLVQAFRELGRNYAAVGSVARVSWRTARRAWEEGVPEHGFGAIRHVIEAEQADGRAAIYDAQRQDAVAGWRERQALLDKARQQRLAARVEEATLVSLLRRDAIAAGAAVAPAIRAALELGKQFEAAVLARKVTPAHLDISPTTGAGFLIGISLIGQETL